ncbi:MAG TPA: hydroxymethylglutaryl-CoA lyase [Acidobacteriaceae bacterium]|nr:hydroxymethylglutaryl-CoA lyase [Acidobacteriaceae bacterium]
MVSDEIKIIECPRDAWQGLPKVIPADVKASYLRELIAAGFQHIDAVSFVSPKAVPQMADSEQVLRLLQAPEDVDIIGIVVNEKGAERAIATESVRTLGFPYSISPGFLERNQHQTPEESLDVLDAIAELAYQAGLDLAVYMSMAFGNPYGDAWSLDEVTEGCSLLIDMGVEQISLADTVGVADPERIASVVSAVIASDDRMEFGVHLHARPDQVEEKVLAAYHAGCRRFDMALGGLGGCPFAQDALIGNIATEQALAALRSAGAKLPEPAPLTDLLARTRQIFAEFGPPLQ